jgi:hypothetical protein
VIGNGHAGFGRAASEKDPQRHLAGVVPRHAATPRATERKWTREQVHEAMRVWQDRYGRLPSSYDWSRTHARRRGGQALERLEDGDWPAASVVGDVFGSWEAARAAARGEPWAQRAIVGGRALRS